MTFGSPLDPRAEAKLMRSVKRPNAAKARALALTAIRETFEETGLLLGTKRETPPKVPDGEWAAFAEHRVHPDSLRHPFHRPRHHAAAPGTALRHPLLHR